jgi:hypothetical protein
MAKNKLIEAETIQIDKSANGSKTSNEELLILLEQNGALIEENLRLTKRLHAHMIFSQSMFWVKFLLIVGSLALVFNYLPPMFGNLVGAYQRLQPTSVARCIESEAANDAKVNQTPTIIYQTIVSSTTSTSSQ